LGEPRHSAFAARARKGFGVYGVKVFDFERPLGKQSLSDIEAGIDPDVISPYLISKGGHPRHSNKSVAVFVLDVRSNKTPWRKGLEAFRPDMDGDFLGKEQWEWLEAAVPRSRAAVNIFVSGLQVHANIFPDGNKAESWGKYPTAQQRLFDLILQDSVGAPILISGDVHMAQFMRKDCKRDVMDAYVRPLIEMTTSGMTHSWGSLSSPPLDDMHKQPTIFEQYATLASRTFMTLLHHFCPWTDLMRMPSIQDNLIDERNYESGGSDGAKQGKQFSLEKNFGEIEIDWNSQQVTMRAIGENEKVLLSASWSIDQLSGRSVMTDSFLSEKQHIDAKRHVNAQGEWTCISYRGPVSEIYHTAGHIISGVIFIVSFPFPLIVLSYFLVGQFCGLWKKRRNLGKKSSNLL
jgi:PhoD-like phosphatase